jgi:hypothetical protein
MPCGPVLRAIHPKSPDYHQSASVLCIFNLLQINLFGIHNKLIYSAHANIISDRLIGRWGAMYKRLRELRRRRDLSQREIAAYLNLSQTGYSKYETGENEYTV